MSYHSFYFKFSQWLNAFFSDRKFTILKITFLGLLLVLWTDPHFFFLISETEEILSALDPYLIPVYPIDKIFHLEKYKL